LTDEDDFFLALDDLKETIPAIGRRWDPTNRAWLVGHGYLIPTRRWAHRWFGPDELVLIEDPAHRQERTPPPRTAPAQDDPYRVLHLLPTAPPELVKAAYRTLSKVHHPDHGGDELSMKRLNRAFEKLSRLKGIA
jgi:hypothetical protein